MPPGSSRLGQIYHKQKNLDAATEELKNFLAQPQNVAELQKDIDAKLELITQFKTQLIELDVEEKALKASLERARASLAKEPRYLELDKSILDEPVMAGLAPKETDDVSKAAGLTVKSQDLPAFVFVCKLLICPFAPAEWLKGSLRTWEPRCWRF